MKDTNMGAASMTVTRAVWSLSKAYSTVINKKQPLKRFPSVMLWGAPGIGKSQGVKQIAQAIEENTGKRVIVTDVRLLLFNPVDLRGIPTANSDKTLAIWLKPKIFQMDESEEVINILLLDEISAAPQSVQAAAYQITLDRTVGEHKLPDNCIVIAAGNRVTDKSVAYSMPKALSNRLCHIEITVDSNSWHNWAISAGVNHKVVGFISCNPDMLMKFDSTSDDISFPTPRSWEMVSNVLNSVSDNISDVFEIIVGCIGEKAAHEFLLWSEVYNKIPKTEDIFSGKLMKLDARTEIIFMLCSKLTFEAANRPKDEIENLVYFAENLPQEFRNGFYTDLLQVEGITKILSENRIYNQWFSRAGKEWNDYL